MRKTFLGIWVLFAFIMGMQNHAFSRDLYEYAGFPAEVVNRSVNMQGLTGLLFTNSAYTQPAGSVTFGLSALGENSHAPEYSVGQGTASITIGITDRVEAGIRGKILGTNFGSSRGRETGIGDTDLLLKWRFSSQGESMPALAFGLAFTFPTGDSDKGFTEVKNESVRLMVIAAGENRVLNDGFVGIYIEGQAVFNDQLRHNDEPYRDKYGVVNAGLLFPLSDENQLQFLLEYTRVLKRDRIMLYDQNYTGVMPGLRYVTDNFGITLGVQRINREHPGLEPNTKGNRYAGTVSYRF